MTRLLAAVWRDEAGTAEHCAATRRLLALQVWPHRLASGFPFDDVHVAGKTGTLPTVRNEVGVVEYPDGGRDAVAVFTRTASPPRPSRRPTRSSAPRPGSRWTPCGRARRRAETREGRGRAPSCTRGDATARPGLPSGRNLSRRGPRRAPTASERGRRRLEPTGPTGPTRPAEPIDPIKPPPRATLRSDSSRTFRALYCISSAIMKA
ncbi:hypothetical protein GCM10009601_16460 [Streptomyces thermospinosisporus]|uniref:Beta-lactamase class A catalytic domain-containing protein n=1 Tax=Streptomyces thermospinosisporus TaxID=161482 RepID=A0ABP4JH75_9ACTN